MCRCTQVANTDQGNTDGDLFGKSCDTDLNNDALTTKFDFGLFKQSFGCVATYRNRA